MRWKLLIQHNHLLGSLLDTSFEVTDPPPRLESFKILLHETQFEFALIGQNNIIVNEALRVACKHLGLEKVEWSRGGNETGKRTFPDWRGVSAPDYQRNILPGDSKLTRNFFRSEKEEKEEKKESKDSDGLPILDPSNSGTDLARSCLQQMNHEAAIRKLRYFYIVTNKELFLCRRMQDPHLNSPIATRRPERSKGRNLLPTPIQPLAFTSSSTLSSPPPSPLPASSPPPVTVRSQRLAARLDRAATSLPSSYSASPATTSQSHLHSDSTYQGDDIEDDTGHPECVSISWDEKDGLTVNLGLFVIHLLALISNEIRTGYELIHLDPDYVEKLNV